MDLIKNLKNEFRVDSNLFLKQNFHSLKLKGIGNVVGKVTDLNMESTVISVTGIENLDETINYLTEELIATLERDVEKLKKVCQKVIDAWEKTPEKFIKQIKRHDPDHNVYDRKGLLSSDEYMTWVAVYFLKYSKHFSFDFFTGYGGDTYYPREKYEKAKVEIDAWKESIIKDLRSKPTRDKFKKYLLKTQVVVPHKDIEKCLELNKKSLLSIFDTAPNPKKKPPLPLSIPGNVLNDLLNECDDLFEIDDEIIKYCKEEHDFDISVLKGWELSGKTEGYHHTDGQICEYEVTLSSPEGHEYTAFNDHCLMTGYNFNMNEPVEFN